MRGDDLMKLADLTAGIRQRQLEGLAWSVAQRLLCDQRMTPKILVKRLGRGAGIAIYCFRDARQQRAGETGDG